MRPLAGIEFGVGWSRGTSCDSEQRAEGVERIEPPVEAKRKLIERLNVTAAGITPVSCLLSEWINSVREDHYMLQNSPLPRRTIAES